MVAKLQTVSLSRLSYSLSFIPAYATIQCDVRSITATEIVRGIAKIKPPFEADPKSPDATFAITDRWVKPTLTSCQCWHRGDSKKYRNCFRDCLLTDFNCNACAMPPLLSWFGIPCPADRPNHKVSLNLLIPEQSDPKTPGRGLRA